MKSYECEQRCKTFKNFRGICPVGKEVRSVWKEKFLINSCGSMGSQNGQQLFLTQNLDHPFLGEDSLYGNQVAEIITG